MLTKLITGILFLTLLHPLLAQNDSLINLPKEYKSISEALKDPLAVEVLVLKNKRLKEFPKEILACTNLRILNLRNNKIETIPKEISQLQKLEVLNLSINRFNIFPEEVVNIPNLKELILSQNLFTILPSSISQLKKLEKLIIWNTYVKSMPASMKEMASTLKVLDLRMTTVQDDQEIDAIEKMLPNTKVLFPAPCNCLKNMTE